MDFEKYVYLDATSPTGLRWSYEGGKGVGKHYKGDVAGVKQQEQAYRIWLAGNFYKVHRIIYQMYYCVELEDIEVIDHINGDPFDNSVTNLRAVTRKVNSRNMNMNKNNKTGIVGVCVDEKKSGHKYAVAQWRDLEGKQKSKSFSFLVHGEEGALELAQQYREAIIYDLNIMGAGYTDDHGVRQLIPNNVKRG